MLGAVGLGWHHVRVGWQELADAIVARRVELGYPTREAFLEVSDIKARTLGDLETGRRTSYSASTLARLERALQWPAGRVREILAGAQTAEQPPQDEIARAIARDDFALVWLLTNAGLSPPDLLRVELVVRRRREELERTLLAEVAALVAELGGAVSYPWDEPVG